MSLLQSDTGEQFGESEVSKMLLAVSKVSTENLRPQRPEAGTT